MPRKILAKELVSRPTKTPMPTRVALLSGVPLRSSPRIAPKRGPTKIPMGRKNRPTKVPIIDPQKPFLDAPLPFAPARLPRYSITEPISIRINKTINVKGVTITKSVM